MLVFSNRNKHFIRTVDFKGVPIQLLFDTGASRTVLSIQSVQFITRAPKQLLVDFIESSEGYSHTSANGMSTKIVPCYLRNFRIDELVFPKFVFGIGLDINVSLLGWDFIDACSLSKGVGDNLRIVAFDCDRFLSNFRLFGTLEEHELLLFTDTTNTWFSSLSDVMKVNLRAYSEPLYAALMSGNCPEEYKLLLEGFKLQYGLE